MAGVIAVPVFGLGGQRLGSKLDLGLNGFKQTAIYGGTLLTYVTIHWPLLLRLLQSVSGCNGSVHVCHSTSYCLPSVKGQQKSWIY